MTDYAALEGRIRARIARTPEDPAGYRDLFDLCRNMEADGDFDGAHTLNRWLRFTVSVAIKNRWDVAAFFELYKRTLLFDAPYDFDSYLLYMEIDRRPQERFYQPRRRVLKQLVDALQAITDGELDELFLSEPPRVGKTTMLMFYVTWLLGRDSERSNLYSAYSDTITKALYNGVMEVIDDPVTYKWNDVFPNAKIAGTNAADETLDIDRKKHYPSLTCRSLYGTLNGACDCNGILIADDLIGGIEEALNKDRMISAWSKVDNNLIPRAKENAKIVWVGTRWSVIDPAGLRMELLKTSDEFKGIRYKIINLPALDENDESNFDYDYGVGFSTDYYRRRRASFERNNDMASWNAQYMGEPIEREGTLFTPNDFRFYNGVLPDEVPDRIFMPVDPAFGGGDFLSSPVCVMYGNDIYIPAVVYTDEDKKITQPLLARTADRYDAAAMQIEANKSTETYRDGVEEELKKLGRKLNLTTKPAPPTKSKEQRIYDKAPDIRERMIFLEEGKRDKAYRLFMQNVYSFKVLGKNTHDDAPDSLAMAIDMVSQKPLIARAFRRD